jgi:hypothetical protein
VVEPDPFRPVALVLRTAMRSPNAVVSAAIAQTATESAKDISENATPPTVGKNRW